MRGLIVNMLALALVMAAVLCFSASLPGASLSLADPDDQRRILVGSLVAGILAGGVNWYFKRHPPKSRRQPGELAILMIVAVAVVVLTIVLR